MAVAKHHLFTFRMVLGYYFFGAGGNGFIVVSGRLGGNMVLPVCVSFRCVHLTACIRLQHWFVLLLRCKIGYVRLLALDVATLPWDCSYVTLCFRCYIAKVLLLLYSLLLLLSCNGVAVELLAWSSGINHIHYHDLQFAQIPENKDAAWGYVQTSNIRIGKKQI